jgi:hypothetical protein
MGERQKKAGLSSQERRGLDGGPLQTPSTRLSLASRETGSEKSLPCLPRKDSEQTRKQHILTRSFIETYQEVFTI